MKYVYNEEQWEECDISKHSQHVWFYYIEHTHITHNVKD